MGEQVPDQVEGIRIWVVTVPRAHGEAMRQTDALPLLQGEIHEEKLCTCTLNIQDGLVVIHRLHERIGLWAASSRSDCKELVLCAHP